MRNPIAAYRNFFRRGLSDSDRIDANLECSAWNIVFVAFLVAAKVVISIVKGHP